MREETLRDGLTREQVSSLVDRLRKSSSFRVIHAAKNFWYIGLREYDGPPKARLGPANRFDGFEPPTYVGVVKKSSAGLISYKESDSRTEHLNSNGYYDKFRKIVAEL